MALVKAVSQDGTIIFARDSDEITDTNTIAKYYKGIDCSGEVRLFSKYDREHHNFEEDITWNCILTDLGSMLTP